MYHVSIGHMVYLFSASCIAGVSTQTSVWQVAEIDVHSLILWGRQDVILDRGKLLRPDERFLCLEFSKVAAL